MSNDYDTNTASASPQERQPPLNRRFEFASYAETRQFLDRLADLSKREDYYPNVSFGKTYANVSIEGADHAALSASKSIFIAEMEVLAAAGKT